MVSPEQLAKEAAAREEKKIRDAEKLKEYRETLQRRLQERMIKQKLEKQRILQQEALLQEQRMAVKSAHAVILSTNFEYNRSHVFYSNR